MLVFRGSIHHGTGDGMIHVTMSGTPQGLKQTSTQTLKELFKGYLQRFTDISLYIYIYKILIIDQYNIHLFIYIYISTKCNIFIYIYIYISLSSFANGKKHVSTSPISNPSQKKHLRYLRLAKVSILDPESSESQGLGVSENRGTPKMDGL